MDLGFKEKRERLNITQKEVARILNVSNTTISMWETGDTLPRADMLPKIAALYGCTIDDLLLGGVCSCQDDA